MIALSMNLGGWDRLNVASGLELVRILRLMLFYGMVFLLGTVFEGGWVRSCIVMVIQDITLSIDTLLTAVVWGLFSGKTFLQVFRDETIIYGWPMLALNLVVYLLGLWIFRRRLRWFRDLPVERYLPARLLSLTVLLFLTTPQLYKLSVPGVSSESVPALVMYAAIVTGGSVFFLYYLRFEMIRRQNQILKRQNELLQEHMELTEEQLIRIRKLRHDLNRNIRVFEWTAETKTLTEEKRSQILRYRDRLRKWNEELQAGVYTGDPDIDAMVFPVAQYCRRAGIPCEIRLRQMDDSGISEQARRNLAFALAYWTFRCMQYRGTVVRQLVLSGGTVAGVNRFRIALAVIWDRNDNRVRRSFETWRRKTRKELTKISREAGADGMFEIREEADQIILDAEWQRNPGFSLDTSMKKR